MKRSRLLEVQQQRQTVNMQAEQHEKHFWRSITISYFNEKWEFKEEVYEGIPARIIQHEYDHIEGVLFTDHISPFKKRLLQRKLNDISKGKIEQKYRMVFPS